MSIIPVPTNTATTEIVLTTAVTASAPKEGFNINLYPNPTSGEMTVAFSLTQTAKVEVKLFNALGQLTKNISNSTLEAGNNTITFSTENIPPGIYHLQFSVDGEVVMKKVVKM